MGGRYITEEGEQTLERIRMRHEHERGRMLRDLYDVAKADDRMERISHMMIQADNKREFICTDNRGDRRH